MFEIFQKLMTVWPTFFYNGLVQYANDAFVAPMMGRMFGMPGAYVANGAAFAAQAQGQSASYLQAKEWGSWFNQ